MCENTFEIQTSTILESGGHWTRSWLLILQIRQQWNTPLSTSVEQWSSHITTMVRKAQKRLYFLRKLRKAKFRSQILVRLYRGATENILTGNVTNWHGSWTAQDMKVKNNNITGTTEHQWHQGNESCSILIQKCLLSLLSSSSTLH